jgi:hypothetical protein
VIRFNCECGKRLKVDDSYAGRNVKCGACGARVQAPAAEIEVAEEVAPPPAPSDGLDALAQALRAGPVKSPRSDVPALRAVQSKKPAGKMPGKAGAAKPLQPGQKGVRPAANQNKAVYIGLGVAAGLILIVVVIMAATMGGDPPKPVKVEAAPLPPPPPPVAKKTNPEHFPGEFFPNVKPSN